MKFPSPGFGPRYATSPAVCIYGRRVIKKVDSLAFDRELGLSRSAYALGRESGLFRVPEVIACERDVRIIQYEHIPDFVTIGQSLLDNVRDTDLIQQAGRALACIHERLEVPVALRCDVCRDWVLSDNRPVPLHGDYNTINVGYSKRHQTLIVLDWCGAPMFGKATTHGPRCLEIAHFIWSTIAHQAHLTDALHFLPQRTEAFIRGYEDGLSRGIDRSLLGRYLVHVGNAHVHGPPVQRMLAKRIYYRVVSVLARRACRKQAAVWLDSKAADLDRRSPCAESLG